MFIENIYFIYFTAFFTGFLGGVHCIGMCGSIIFVLSTTLPKDNKYKMYLYYVCYNVGRVTSYAFSGFLAGFLGFLVLNLTGTVFFIIVKIVGGISLIGVGLYLGGCLSTFNLLEKVGCFFWSKIQPYAIKMIPIKSIWQAVLIGILWGNLPCGLVYSALIWSLSFGSIFKSFTLMLTFGVGTLPVMLISVFFMSYFKFIFQNKLLKFSVCLVMIFFGTLNIVNALLTNSCH